MIPSDKVAFSSTEILSMRIKELVMQVMEATVDLKNQNKPTREREQNLLEWPNQQPGILTFLGKENPSQHLAKSRTSLRR